MATRPPSATTSPTPTPSPSARTAVLNVTNESGGAVRLTVNDVGDVTLAAGTSGSWTVVVREDDEDTVFLGSVLHDCGTELKGVQGLEPDRTYRVTVADSPGADCETDDGALVTRPAFSDGPPWQDIG